MMRIIFLPLIFAVMVGLGGCANIQRALTIYELRGAHASAIATPALLEQCRLAILQRTEDFKPKAPLRPDAAAGLMYTGAVFVDQKLPNGGNLVVFTAPYDEIGLFGQKTPSLAGCIYEMTDKELIFIKAYHAGNYN